MTSPRSAFERQHAVAPRRSLDAPARRSPPPPVAADRGVPFSVERVADTSEIVLEPPA